VFIPRHLADRCLKYVCLIPNLSDKPTIQFGIRLSLFQPIAKLFQPIQVSTKIRNIQF